MEQQLGAIYTQRKTRRKEMEDTPSDGRATTYNDDAGRGREVRVELVLPDLVVLKVLAGNADCVLPRPSLVVLNVLARAQEQIVNLGAGARGSVFVRRERRRGPKKGVGVRYGRYA